MKKRTCFVSILSCGLLANSSFPAEPLWQPRTAPLMTRWAKEVSRGKAHPEYPRPQLVRQE
ncbi:MAG TPA: hypothetical protein VEO53_13375, partial [Candidatus Binatia bacterium]|nr:hypothetical protein [Candidatus Binatia bacterium]